MTYQQWNEWLETVADEEIEGFEDGAHEWARKYAQESGDITSESCLTSFFGDNPRQWLEEAFDSITGNCKSKDQASDILKRLYEDTVMALSLS